MDRDQQRRDVLVAERQALFRHGLIGILRDAWPDWSFDQAGSFDEASQRMAAGAPALLLLDLDLPGLQGPDGIGRLLDANPASLVMVLADTDDRGTILRCLGAGAQGYVLKSASPLQFLRALETVLAGGVFAPASLSGKPVTAPPRPAPQVQIARELDPLLAQLTDRQRDVFRLLAEGCATKTIARRLDLAVGTVKVHLAAIYRALGAHSRLEALAKARNGVTWLDMPVPTPAEPERQAEDATSYLG